MIFKLINKLIGDPNEKFIKKAQKLVTAINEKEKEYQQLTDEQIKGHTEMFRKRLQDGATTDDLLVEAFATVKNACRRLCGTKYTLGKEEKTWNMVPFDVQLMGAIALHQGNISEMKTGEGKTLTASLPLYLNALEGKGAHLVTVNDYLAKRDAHWMGTLYGYLGLTVGTIVHGLSHNERQQAYGADITYGTNNEFGFNYLRDNMAESLAVRVQREPHYAIVDEVDSILIDEARTPLIISAPAEESTEKYYQYSKLVEHLQAETHYVIDEKGRVATLTEAGIAKMEELMGVDNIYTDAGFMEVHHIEQALKAKAIFRLDRDYVIKDGEIIIVDEFTGRLMPGRRYSDGLHQAIEAKENVEIKRESRTLATITFQNYFRLYKKLAGMTGTAKTEEEEFYKIYGLETVVMPTNRPMTRQDLPDLVFKNETGKISSIVSTVKELYGKGQPVLVGTVSVEKSERLSKFLEKERIPHQVLNAKNHEREAEIVALAGQKGAVTIATNMAGRGTDIQLGEGVSELGGLYIIGSERHESRRIDNQLRGRSGRQGDPGASRFFVSMDDDLMRMFGSDKIKGMMERLGLPDDMPIENGIISRSIESAQKRVEGHHFDIRKHLLEYDDVMNKHREIIYSRRLKLLSAEDLKLEFFDIIRREAEQLTLLHTQNLDRMDFELQPIVDGVNALLPPKAQKLDVQDIEKLETSTEITEFISNIFISEHKALEDSLPDPSMLRKVEKAVMLRVIDTLWMDHIDQMTQLRENVALRGYGQRDPLLEYKQEAFLMFKKLLSAIQHNSLNTFFKVQINIEAATKALEKEEVKAQENLQTNEADIEKNLSASDAKSPTSRPAPSESEVGRNDPCHCGSGKKFKKCHGA